MSGISALLLSSLLFVRAPVPPEPTPDPMARGYLGITVGEGVVIEAVQAGTPAAHAGLRPRDVVLRAGTLKPPDYKELVAHICSFRPGAVVEIEIQRGTERKAFKVKLASRPSEINLNRLIDPTIEVFVPEP